ncbi:MAG: glycerol-3-phosphate acyltransferase [Gemmatimonadales bacterium]
MGIVSGAVAAYLVGCVPLARLTNHVTQGRPWAPWASLAADALKGVLATLLFAPVGSVGQALTVAAVVAGDQWPVFGRQTGRSGLVVCIAAMTALTPVTLVVWGLGWGIGFVSSGYFSLARLVGTALLPVLLGLATGWPLGLAVLPACIMVLERQRGSLKRLLRGQEAKHYWRAEA